ncbi:hypothetical protein ABR850_06815 [Aeromonas veronii]|uniref:hypothetical protein n=1 Tax=Aeromonas veronii TaxID=654 RepID=UPI0033055F35|nr:hypothetical protein [Aeromonas veronii]
MKELSIEELELVSGAMGPAGAVVGGIAGGAGYIGSATVTGEGDVAGFAGAVGSGAAVGFLGPMGGGVALGAEVVLATQVGFYGGMLSGFIEDAFNWAGADYAGQNYQK